MISRFLCLMLLALASLSGIDALAARPACGDNKCNGGETVITCPADCDASGDSCGDAICGATETCSTCTSDCGVCPPASDCNNDGTCNLGEDCLGCPNDCAGITSGKKADRYCCGGATVTSLYCGPPCEDSCGTPLDYTPECGNDLLENGEECDDGNTSDGDGCSGSCTLEYFPACGNGILDEGEACDDGNLDNGDGCDSNCQPEPPDSLAPSNQFNIGDSIGEAESANGTIGATLHQSVWSTGYSASDIVISINERYELADPNGYFENNSTRDDRFNKAISGSVMADFPAQAQQVVDSVAGLPTGSAGQITILLGANDVCADTNDSMTDPALFEAQLRAGLEILAAHDVTRLATIHLSSLPAIYWLWESRADTSPFSWCRLFAWPNVPCQNLLSNSGDDCESLTSRRDPDNIYPGDGQRCVRRKHFHARIRDEFNPILQSVLTEFANRAQQPLPNAEYIDIFGVRFDSVHVNGGDCFHPSLEGHELLSTEQYCRSSRSEGDNACTN